uniref:Uncharacterized protein n=1 Tax=Arundo donax TaxID=35708 RepID=A0A0A8ZZ28_ARUDO
MPPTQMFPVILQITWQILLALKRHTLNSLLC